MPVVQEKSEDILSRPENRFLLGCARMFLHLLSRSELEVFTHEPMNWPYLIGSAHRHGLLPLVYSQLRIGEFACIPADIMGKLRLHFHATELRNRRLATELVRLLSLFDSNNIHAIPFKGPVLTESLYGSLALRPFSDLDIMVQDRDVLRAKKLLMEAGYAARTERDSQQERALVKNHWEYKFIKKDGRIRVELQWRITSKFFSFPVQDLISKMQIEKVALQGVAVRNFPPESLLLILCVHGARHGWNRLIWICDVAALLTVNRNLDWEWILESIDRLGLKRILLLGLYLAHELFGVEMPHGLLREIKTDTAVKAIYQQVTEHLCRDSKAPKNELDKSLGRLKKSIFRIKLRERSQDRFHFFAGFLHRLFTPTADDLAAFSLPRILYPCYFLLRPIRLLLRYGRNFVKQLHR